MAAARWLRLRPAGVLRPSDALAESTVPDSDLPVPDSDLPVPDSDLPVPDSDLAETGLPTSRRQSVMLNTSGASV